MGVLNLFKRKDNHEYFRRFGVNAMNTPDILELSQYQRQNIFVSDDMMRKGKLFDYIEETSLTGRHPMSGGYTEEEFFFWQKSLGEDSFPVALRNEVSGFCRNPPEKARIRGQLFSIRPYQFTKLDFLKDNQVQFIRERINILVPHYKSIYDKKRPIPEIVTSVSTVPAWMYIGVNEYWDDMLGGVFSSKPIPLLDHSRPEIGKFYAFNNEQDR
jgi:hypothetical protein